MKKFLGFALIVLLLAGLCMSCSSDVEDEIPDKVVSLDLRIDADENSKSLTVETNNNIVTDGVDAYYWTYTAVKKDSYGKVGEVTSQTPLNGATGTGLAPINNLSTGKWLITLNAFLKTDHAKQVYTGSVEVELLAEKENRVIVPIKRCQISSQKGTIIIAPENISIAYDSGSVVFVNDTTGNVDFDEEADRRLFGKLSEYSYTVYDCNSNWVELTTLTNSTSKETATTWTNANATPRTYYFKFKLAKDNDAVQYIAMIEFEVYSNCTTVIGDCEGEDAGIKVKRLKEYNVYYFDTTNTSVDVPFSGTHVPIADEDVDGNLMYVYYPKTHQYGRTEVLDEPTKEGFGFAGYYEKKNPDATDVPWTAIPAYYNKDVYLYAKWDTKNYKSITWDNNWPKLAQGRTTNVGCSGDGSKSGEIGSAFVVPSTEPVCVGYKFVGWYIDDPKFSFNSGSTMPDPTRHDQVVVFKAYWEPITYRIEFYENKGADSFTIDNWTEIKALENTMNAGGFGVEYDLAEMVLDAESKTKGFLGWCTQTTYDKSKMVGADGTVVNLTTVDRATVKLYAIWSEYFVPLEYIRSNPASQTTGPYIDTLLTQANCNTIKMNVEIAGETFGWEVLCGNGGGSGTASRNLNVGIYTTNISQRNDKWSNLNGNLTGIDANMGGLIFEDQRYDIEVYSGSNGSHVMVDGEKILSDSTAVGSNGYKISLFNQLNSNTTNKYCTNMRLYSCQMYDAAGNIKRKFVPCRLVKQVDVAARSSDGLTTHKGDNENGGEYKGEVGLWDLVENQFYPNKMSGCEFYEPHDEVKVTLKSNYTGSEQADRIQRVLSGVSEKLHKNVFSNVGKSYLSWNTKANGTGTDVFNRDSVTYTADQVLYAKWTGTTSWALFGQVDYIESHERPHTEGGECIDSGLAFGTFGGSYRITLITQHLSIHSRSGEDTVAKEYPTMIGCYAGQAPDGTDFYKQGLIQRILEQKWGAHWVLLDDSGKNVVSFTTFNCPEKANTNKVKIVAQTRANVESSFNYYQGAALDTWVAGASNTHSNSISSNYKATLYVFAMHDEYWTSANRYDDRMGSKYSNCAYGRVYSLVVDNLAGSIKANFVPCVLNQDLDNTHKVKNGDGVEVIGTTKVYGGLECHKGEAGLWDTVNDRFHPNIGIGAFEYPTDKYLIRFDPNGGIGVMDNQEIASTTTTRLIECRFEREGYEFIGWTDLPKSTDAGVKWYSPERVMHPSDLRNVTLFAQWRKKPTSTPYVQLEYIRNDNTGFAWIDTGVVSKKNFRVNYKLVKTINLGGDCPFGRRLRDAGKHVGTIFSTSIYVNESPYDVSPQTLGVPVEVDVQSLNDLAGANKLAYSAYPGKSATGIASPAADGTVNNSLFGVSKGAGGENPGCAFYFAKIYDDKEILVRDFIPVMLTEEVTDVTGVKRPKNSLGMWDKCNNKFYANANTAGKGYFVNDDIVTIIFDANGGSGIMDSMAFVESNDKVALTANKFTHPQGKAFIGWNTKADGQGVWYSDEYNTNAWEGGVHTMYAQWEKEVGLIYTEYFEPVNKIMLGNGAYINLGPIDEAYVNCTFYNSDFSLGGFFMGADNHASSGNVSGVLKRFNPNILTGGAVAAGKMTISMNVGATGTWSDKYDTTKVLNKGACTYLTVYTNPTTNKFGYSACDGTNSISKDLDSYSGDFRCGNDWLLFASTRDNVYNPDAIAAKGGGYCGGVKWVRQDGTVWFNMIPCRLIKKIGSYVAGKLSADRTVHRNGEYGFWDIENNLFYSNGSALGEFYCELD